MVEFYKVSSWAESVTRDGRVGLWGLKNFFCSLSWVIWSPGTDMERRILLYLVAYRAMTLMIAIVIDAEHSHLRVIIWGIFFFVSTYQTQFVVRCTIYTNFIHALLAIRTRELQSYHWTDCLLCWKSGGRNPKRSTKGAGYRFATGVYL